MNNDEAVPASLKHTSKWMAGGLILRKTQKKSCKCSWGCFQRFTDVKFSVFETGIQNSLPRNPLWFFSHWRIESKHRMGTALTKAQWEEVLHSNGWTLVILAYSSFHTLKVCADKELCPGWFWNPSISIGPEWTPLSRKVFCPRKYHSAAWGVMLLGMLQYVFQRTFPWGKRQNIALVSDIA